MDRSDDPNEAVRLLAAGGWRGPRPTFDRLFAEVFSLLERFAKQRLRYRWRVRGDFLKDCVQEWFLRIIKYRKSYRGTAEAEFWRWLQVVCDNTAKRMFEHHFDNSGPADPSNGGVVALDHLERSEAIRALRECLRELDDTESGVIVLWHFPPRLPLQAIAEILGCAKGNVARIKKKASGKLLRCLRRKGIDSLEGS